MQAQHNKVLRLGFAFCSPMDVIVALPDNYKNTTSSEEKAEVHFSNVVGSTSSKVQLIFAALQELEAHKITILDCLQGKPSEVDWAGFTKIVSTFVGF